MEAHSSRTMLQDSQSRRDFDQQFLALIKNKQDDNYVIRILNSLIIWNAQDKIGNSFLHYAARYNNQVIVNYLIESGSTVDIRNNFAETPLILAIKNGATEAIGTLVEAGANIYDPDSSGRNALYWLVHSKGITIRDTVKEILNKVQTDCNYDTELITEVLWNVGCSLHYVVLMKNIAVTKAMLQRGYPVDERSNRGQTALHIAVQSIDVEHVKLLLEHNADPNAMDDMRQSTLCYLYSFCQKHTDEHLQILKILIVRNAALTVTIGRARKTSSRSQVHSVLRLGNRDAIETLLFANLDLNEKIDVFANTAIHILVQNETPGVFRALDRWYFNANARNSHSETPLHVAADCGNALPIEYLLTRGADINAVNDHGLSPLFCAVNAYISDRSEKYKEFVEILMENGADAQQKSARTSNGPLTILELIRSKLSDAMVQILIAHLVVREAIGMPINNRTRSTLNSSPVFKMVYNFLQEELTTVVDKSVILLDLLCASDLKFEKYVRNQEWVLKMQRLCSEGKSSFCYLYRMLDRRIKRSVEMIELKVDAACVLCNIMNVEYACLYLIADRIVSYLSVSDLLNLLEMTI